MVITFEEWSKAELRVGEIKEAKEHPNADKLYVLRVDLGENVGERTIVAGIRKAYEKDELIGKKIIVVANLTPVVLRGVKSEGMLLAASDDKELTLLTVDSDVSNGSRIS
jgi:methionyl-tRNA synthetase